MKKPYIKTIFYVLGILFIVGFFHNSYPVNVLTGFCLVGGIIYINGKSNA